MGQTKVEVRLEGETAWLTQAHMAELFQTTVPNVSMHLRNVYAEGELQAAATVKEFLIVRQEGTRQVSRMVEHYNLDAIISVGYRVKRRRRHPLPHLGHPETSRVYRQGVRPRRRAAQESRPAGEHRVLRLCRRPGHAPRAHAHARPGNSETWCVGLLSKRASENAEWLVPLVLC